MFKFLSLFFVICCPFGFSQELSFNPKLNHPYTFDTELIMLEASDLELGFKTTIETQFLEDDDFSMNIKLLQINAAGYALDSEHPETKDDSIQFSKITSQPFLFKFKEGKLILKNHTEIAESENVKDILNEFGRYYHSQATNFFKNIVLKKGYSWSQTDSIPMGILRNSENQLTFDYRVKDVTRKQLVLHGKSTYVHNKDTTYIAVKYILDKKTGMPLYTKMISKELEGSAVLMINKLQGFKAPDMFKEYISIQPQLLSSYWHSLDYTSDTLEYKYNQHPLITNKDSINSVISWCLDNLEIQNYKEQPGVFLSSYSNQGIEKAFPVLNGVYSTINKIRFITDRGTDVSLKQNPLSTYYTPIQISSFYKDFYKPTEKITTVELDLTTYKPTDRKYLEEDGSTENSQYQLVLTDSTMIINFKKQLNIDTGSFRFFDAQGNELKASWNMNYQQDKLFTNDESITQSFIRQNANQQEFSFGFIFYVTNASRVQFALFTDEFKFRHQKTISLQEK